MSKSSVKFLEKLMELIKAPGFKCVPSTMYVPLMVLKDFAKVNRCLQFLVMTECDGKKAITIVCNAMLLC